MRRVKFGRILAVSLLAAGLTCGSALSRDQDDCRKAKDGHKAALSYLSSALNQYINCVELADGTNDCKMEFEALQDDQNDFEAAVNSIQLYCDQ